MLNPRRLRALLMVEAARQCKRKRAPTSQRRKSPSRENAAELRWRLTLLPMASLQLNELALERKLRLPLSRLNQSQSQRARANDADV